VGDDDGLGDGPESPVLSSLDHLSREHGFDDFIEAQCVSFYAETTGSAGIAAENLFRLLLTTCRASR
jgi:hypothetical protein